MYKRLKNWWRCNWQSKHEWRANDVGSDEMFPVCKHCGKTHWWPYGYTLNSGRRLFPEPDAIAVWDSALFDSDETIKRSHEYWSCHEPT